MPRTARLLAAAVVIALPLLLASCSRTYSNGHEFRNGNSFAALKADGSVVAWGGANRGGDPACVVNTSSCGAAATGSLSSGVTSIFSSYGAYAALKQDGSLVVWGSVAYGGDISCTLAAFPCNPVSQATLSSGVRAVTSTFNAFAATKTDGSVVTWGPKASGGDASCAVTSDCSPAPAGSLSSGVAQVFAGYEAFAALKTDGSAVAWGNPAYGGDASAPVGGTLTGLTDIVPNGSAFAARTSVGGVVTWGNGSNGGDPTCPAPCSPAAAGSLTSGITAITNTDKAFAARKSDGSVVSWGDAPSGGDSSAPVGGALTGVTSIFATSAAFAALKSDGSVVTWGGSNSGGDASCTPGASCSPAPAGSLASGVTAIFASEKAFAALKQDGSVVTWGDPERGGDSACDPTPGTCTPAPAGSLSGGVTQIMWMTDAFVAAKQDGSVVTWGSSGSGGSSLTPVGGALTGVGQVFSNDSAGAALREDGSVATWGAAENGGDPGCDPTSQACSPAPPGSLSSGVIYIASPFVDAPTPPSAPTSLVAAAGDASASIAFTAGAANGQPITGYEYSLNEGAWTAASPATTTSPVVISGLTNGTTYGVRLRALNSRGAGPTSTSVNVTPVATAAASTSVPALAGRTTCDRLVCTTRGRVPSGATRVTQVAAAISTAAQHRARANAATSTRRVSGKCTIAGSGTARTYTCTIRLSRGRWAITTTALKGSTVAARSVKNVRISRVAPKRAVTG
ncbi:MAG: fibronectin type III domain-containing protein [Actinobacteria bacterium]|nr:fibronectin type III domain-containing protein [Actinomycetota bacterium]